MIFEKVRDIICEQFDLEPDQVTENTAWTLWIWLCRSKTNSRLKSPKRKSAILKPSATS